jgi:voltage-gated potassium channel
LARNQDAYDRFSTAVELPLAILAALWLVVLIVPLVMHVPADVSDTFLFIDYAVWACFVIEYLVKLYLAPDRGHFFMHHLLDLLVVCVPFLRPLRAARLVAVLRGFVLFANAFRRAKDLLTHKGFHFVVLAVVGLLFVCSAIVLLFERHAHGSTIHNYGEALWWGIVTITTVGYGDRFPLTAAGKGTAVVLMLAGIGLIGALTATIASYFIGGKEDEAGKERAEILDRLDRIETLLQGLSRTALQDGTTRQPRHQVSPSSDRPT